MVASQVAGQSNETGTSVAIGDSAITLDQLSSAVSRYAREVASDRAWSTASHAAGSLNIPYNKDPRDVEIVDHFQSDMAEAKAAAEAAVGLIIRLGITTSNPGCFNVEGIDKSEVAKAVCLLRCCGIKASYSDHYGGSPNWFSGFEGLQFKNEISGYTGGIQALVIDGPGYDVDSGSIFAAFCQENRKW